MIFALHQIDDDVAHYRARGTPANHSRRAWIFAASSHLTQAQRDWLRTVTRVKVRNRTLLDLLDSPIVVPVQAMAGLLGAASWHRKR